MPPKSADQPVDAADDFLTPVTVDLNQDGPDTDDDTDDVETPEPQPNGQQGQPQSVQRQAAPGLRPERPSRQNYKKVLSETQQVRAQLDQTTALLQQQAAMIQQMMTSRPQQQQQGQGAATPADDKVTKINAEMNEIMGMVRAGNVTAELADKLSTRYQALQDQRTEAMVEQRLERFRDQLGQQQGQGQADPAIQHIQGVLQAEFPEVMRDDGARSEASALYRFLLAQGRQDGLGLYREAAATTARRRNLGGGRLGPSRQAQAAYAGGPGGATRADDGQFSFDGAALRQIAGSGVSPSEIARELQRQNRGR
jgi:hypothetical protein